MAANASARSATSMPISTISPLDSAVVMNSEGRSRPRSGWCQRTSASNAWMPPSLRETIGWYLTSISPRLTASSRSNAGPRRERAVSGRRSPSFTPYIERSAFRIKSSALAASGPESEIPMLAWIVVSHTDSANGAMSALVSLRAACSAASSSARSTSTANSSPPSRAGRSPARTAP